MDTKKLHEEFMKLEKEKLADILVEVLTITEIAKVVSKNLYK